MKHINKAILFMALAAAAFTACDDDEDPAFAPEVTISRAEGSTSCVPGTTYELTAQTTERVDTLCWLLDGGKVSDAASYTFTAADLGVHEIILRAGNALGEDADTLYFNVHKAEAGRISSVNDITNWTGDGANRSVLAVQWVTGTEILNPADSEVFFRAWGYRWTPGGEDVYGIDMIEAVVKSDPRLFVILSEDGWGTAVKGFGYDGDGDGKIHIRNSGHTEAGRDPMSALELTEADFTDGIYWQKYGESVEEFEVVSEGDWWAGGWHTAYLSYWVGSGEAVLEASEYSYSSLYASGRVLEHQSWDAWTFSPINYETEENILPIPRLLQAAPR